MIDRKLESKISPLQNSKLVNNIFLVRNKKYVGDKIRCYYPIKAFSKNFFLKELYRLIISIYIIIKFDPKVIISAGLVLHGVYANILGRILKKNTILLLMGEAELPLDIPIKSIKNKILLKIALLADRIGVRGTSSKRKLILCGYPAERIFISHNVFLFDDFKSLNVKKEYDLIFIGNFYKEKRIDILINIVNKLINIKGLKINLVLIGEGCLEREIKDQVNTLSLNQKVIIIPFTQKKELNTYLNKSRILVLTSEAEGLPMVVVEALSAGIPTVAFDVANISDIIKDGINGFLIPFGDTELYADKLELLLSNNELYKEFCNSTVVFKQQYEILFSLAYITKKWDEQLHILLKEK